MGSDEVSLISTGGYGPQMWLGLNGVTPKTGKRNI